MFLGLLRLSVAHRLAGVGARGVSGRILLVTGERDAGKTTVCRQTVSLAQAAGHTCGGLLTTPAGDVEQLDVVDAHTGDRRRLTTTSTAGVRQGRYLFDPEALAWGAEALACAVPCDLLVVDELGPLEVQRQLGWAVALDLLRRGEFQVALVVVRPELLADVQSRLSVPASSVEAVTVQNRDRLPTVLLGILEREP